MNGNVNVKHKEIVKEIKAKKETKINRETKKQKLRDTKKRQVLWRDSEAKRRR